MAPPASRAHGDRLRTAGPAVALAAVASLTLASALTLSFMPRGSSARPGQPEVVAEPGAVRAIGQQPPRADGSAVGTSTSPGTPQTRDTDDGATASTTTPRQGVSREPVAPATVLPDRLEAPDPIATPTPTPSRAPLPTSAPPVTSPVPVDPGPVDVTTPPPYVGQLSAKAADLASRAVLAALFDALKLALPEPGHASVVRTLSVSLDEPVRAAVVVAASSAQSTAQAVVDAGVDVTPAELAQVAYAGFRNRLEPALVTTVIPVLQASLTASRVELSGPLAMPSAERITAMVSGAVDEAIDDVAMATAGEVVAQVTKAVTISPPPAPTDPPPAPTDPPPAPTDPPPAPTDPPPAPTDPPPAPTDPPPAPTDPPPAPTDPPPAPTDPPPAPTDPPPAPTDPPPAPTDPPPAPTDPPPAPTDPPPAPTTVLVTEPATPEPAIGFRLPEPAAATAVRLAGPKSLGRRAGRRPATFDHRR